MRANCSNTSRPDSLMSLGDAFPEALRKKSVERQVKPGSIIKLEAVMDDGKLHEKRFIVINVDNETVTLVINTEISDFVQNKPWLLKCQVFMKFSEHPCMKHDSYVDCSRPRVYSEEDVHNQLVNNPAWILGEISGPLCDDIKNALKHSNQIPVRDVAKFCDSLSAKN